jgi:hypothetical protein
VLCLDGPPYVMSSWVIQCSYKLLVHYMGAVPAAVQVGHPVCPLVGPSHVLSILWPSCVLSGWAIPYAV